MDNILDNFFRNDNYNKNICFKFLELYQDYTISEHCRASYKIKDNIKKYLINKIENDLDSLENKKFEELFNIVKKILLVPYKDGGGKIIRTKQGGACGISVLGCYDITMCLVKSIPYSTGPNQIILIKDNTKGPWNYVTKILNLTPKKINEGWCDPYSLYYIEKKELINSEKNEHYLSQIKKSNCDDIESYLCKFWKNRK
jgi:hypothetical protein